MHPLLAQLADGPAGIGLGGRIEGKQPSSASSTGSSSIANFSSSKARASSMAFHSLSSKSKVAVKS
jgi:hypothetical protein